MGLSENLLELTAAQSGDRRAAAAVADRFAAGPVGVAFDVVTWLALVGVLLLLIGAVRGGLVRWWAPAVWPVGIVVYVVSDQLFSGVLLALAALPFVAGPVLLGVGLLRARGTSPSVRVRGAQAGTAPVAV